MSPAETHPAGELERVNLKITLGYQGKQYTHVQWGLADGWDYQWEEGNYSCDCNRSLFIRRYCDPTFPNLYQCGNTIELVDIEETDEPESTILPYWLEKGSDPIEETPE